MFSKIDFKFLGSLFNKQFPLFLFPGKPIIPTMFDVKRCCDREEPSFARLSEVPGNELMG